MINIELTPQQADELKVFYYQELKRVMERAEEIRALLEKLDNLPASKYFNEQLEATASAKKTQAAPKVRKTPVSKKESTGYLNWPSFILQVLQEKNKPLTIDEFYNLYESHYGIKIPDSEKSIQSLKKALYRLRVNEKKIKSTLNKKTKERSFTLIDDDQNEKTIKPQPSKAAKKTLKEKAFAEQAKGTILPTEKKTSYNWTDFVVNVLKKNKRVFTVKDFIKHAMVYYNLPKSEEASIKSKLPPMLTRLNRVKKMLKTVKKPGQRARYYGLPEWFAADGTLIPMYK